jgi:hypothetical protein
VSAGRLLTARSASSVNAAHSPGTHLTSPPQGSAHQQHRGGGLRVLEENPKPPSCRPATSSGSSTFANSSSGRSTHPPTVSRRRCARSIAETLVREGEAARRVSACHRQPAMVEVPARSAVIAVWWVCLAAGAWRGSRRLNGCAQCHHHAPLSALLLSAVHPVTLCTPTQPSTVPLQAGRCVLLSHRSSPFPARRPQRCNVNDARRCWRSSDAEHSRGTLARWAPTAWRDVGCWVLAPRGVARTHQWTRVR